MKPNESLCLFVDVFYNIDIHRIDSLFLKGLDDIRYFDRVESFVVINEAYD